MKRIHVFTTIGLIFVFTGIALMPSQFPLLATIYILAGYLFSIKDVSKYTSWYQFLVVFFAAAIFGLSLEKDFLHFPLLTLAVVVAAGGSILRIVFFQEFTYTKYKWFEPTMFALAVLLYLSGNIFFFYGWQGWTFPVIIIFFQGVLTFGVLKDSKQLQDFNLLGSRIATGKAAPVFELPDQEGSLVSLAEYVGKRNLLLIFVRGDWCPGCHMMLRTYERERKKFQTKDILVLAIGPDPVGVNREMVVKLDLDFKVLSDAGQRTAMQYGVQLAEYENDFAEKYEAGIPLPASFLIDKKGLVQYVSRPDRVGEFLDPRTIFPIIDNLTY
ncbi:MAG: peroxiredoxin family protein [Bacteroidetes bacterium]|nr:peroxiredoxin family protein [Bacteroidota bacterium]